MTTVHLSGQPYTNRRINYAASCLLWPVHFVRLVILSAYLYTLYSVHRKRTNVMNTERDSEREVVTWVRSNSCHSATSPDTNPKFTSRESNFRCISFDKECL